MFPAVHTGGTEMTFLAARTPSLPSLKILCIDDELPVLDVLSLLLKDGGHRVEVASDGPSGLAAFRAARAKREPFDVVLTDFGSMPQMDGIKQVAMNGKRRIEQNPRHHAHRLGRHYAGRKQPSREH